MNVAIKPDIRDRIHCDIIDADSPNYSEACALYNGMIHKKPHWIAMCRTSADVIASVKYARNENILLAVCSGRHNGAGLGLCDGGLVIDLSAMKKIEVDVKGETVRVEPGCTQGEVDAAASRYGLAVPAGIVSTTGVAGLTLGGGHGYLSRQHGLTIDNLIEADIVLADGRRVTANEREHADLFWAIRGGGGNFGVVVSFLYRVHPVIDVTGGPIFWDIEHAKTIMEWYRKFLPTAPRELCSFFGIKTVPSTEPFPKEIWGRRICALINCYNGPQEDAERAMRPIYDNLPEPIMNGVTRMPFTALQGLFDPLLPKGLQWYWKGDFIEELSDEAIAAHVEHGSKSPTELSLMHLYPIDGAVQDVAPDATAWGARKAQWSMVIAGIDPDPAKAPELKTWATDYWKAIHALNTHGGAYVNFMMADEGADRVRAAYGANYERLVAVKRKYDPGNLFRVNQNIAP